MVVGGSLLVLVLLVLIGASVYNVRSDHRPEASEFLEGTLPEPVLNGDYKGEQFTGLGKNWRGKNFSAATNSGINNFANAPSSTTEQQYEQRYPFLTSNTRGLRNTSTSVLQLNYNTGDNPLWLKFIRDELVQVSPNNYLGKIQLKVGFLVVTLGYFHLGN